MRIRDAAPGDMAQVGAVRVTAYQAGGFLPAGSGYAPALRDLGADGNGHELVAVAPSTADHAFDDGPPAAATEAERVVGTIMLQLWPQSGPVVTGPDEAEIRALALRPDAQRRGVGRQLLQRALDRARSFGLRRLILCTAPEMCGAHQLYEQAGFVRLPERDWSPTPGITLLVYGLDIANRSGTKAGG